MDVCQCTYKGKYRNCNVFDKTQIKSKVVKGVVSQREAALKLGQCVRQLKYLTRLYKQDGCKGLVSLKKSSVAEMHTTSNSN